jgi:coenzyme F420-dependent glucose-6-phosphate dehydrogenase
MFTNFSVQRESRLFVGKSFSDNPDDHVKFVQQYLDLGLDTIIFHSPGPDQHAFLERYGHDILPALRSLS